MSKQPMLVWCGVLAVAAAAAADAAAFSVSYDQRMTQGRDVYQAKVSMKDQRFRMEMTVAGQQSIIIRNAEGTYTVMPSEGMAMKTPEPRPGQAPVEGAEDYARYLQQRQAVRTGSETIDGYACDIYRYADPESGGTTTVWVWKDKMFPIRFETETSEGKTLTELSNIQLGAAVPDEAFQLPAGVQVMDMGNLMGLQ